MSDQKNTDPGYTVAPYFGVEIAQAGWCVEGPGLGGWQGVIPRTHAGMTKEAAEELADPQRVRWSGGRCRWWLRRTLPMSNSPNETTGGGVMRPLPEMVSALRVLASNLRCLDSGSGEAALFDDAANYIEGATDSLREHMAEVRRLRVELAETRGERDGLREVIYGKQS